MMRLLFVIFLNLSIGCVGAQFDTTYNCSGRDTLSTWQGVRYCIVSRMSGDFFPKKGNKIYVKYTGYFEDGNVFDESKTGNFYFKFQKLEVIRGWDIVFEKLSIGDKARVFIPWKLAYGKYGNPPLIPRKADLIFDVEVMGIRP